MLKMYQFRSAPGDSPAFWEENWGSDGFDEAVRFCEVDPLRPLFERHVSSGSRMLEGGCGLGQYVAYYGARGRSVVGLDFARETLGRLRRLRRDLVVCVGNVAFLPFRDEAFDAYYSGGVVEHFEGGPEAALREARRVLRPGGVLLVSVPYFSPLRQALVPFRRGTWRRLPAALVEAEERAAGRRFWQYAYTPNEFTRILSGVGFHVVTRQAYSVLWGLYDLPLFSALLARLRERARGRTSGPVPGGASLCVPEHSPGPSAAGRDAPPSLVKRLLVSEDVTIPVAGRVVRMLRASCANMMLYVCERPKEAGE
jgi:SAM-dependent methyltransferase